jgi:hypothetical protein
VSGRQICRPGTTRRDQGSHDRQKWWQNVRSVALSPLLVITVLVITAPAVPVTAGSAGFSRQACLIAWHVWYIRKEHLDA